MTLRCLRKGHSPRAPWLPQQPFDGVALHDVEIIEPTLDSRLQTPNSRAATAADERQRERRERLIEQTHPNSLRNHELNWYENSSRSKLAVALQSHCSYLHARAAHFILLVAAALLLLLLLCCWFVGASRECAVTIKKQSNQCLDS